MTKAGIPLLTQRIDAAVNAMRIGTPVLLFDDDDRENEADLVIAADCITQDAMARLIRDCCGIVCLCLDDGLIRKLDLPPMVAKNECSHGTAFTVSVDARRGISTGVSAADRVATIRTAVAATARPEDLVRPGHIFPLRAAPGGVLARIGHTEGAVDLAILAGLTPAAVICELMTKDGDLLRGKPAKALQDGTAFPVSPSRNWCAIDCKRPPAPPEPAGIPSRDSSAKHRAWIFGIGVAK